MTDVIEQLVQLSVLECLESGCRRACRGERIRESEEVFREVFRTIESELSEQSKIAVAGRLNVK